MHSTCKFHLDFQLQLSMISLHGHIHTEYQPFQAGEHSLINMSCYLPKDEQVQQTNSHQQYNLVGLNIKVLILSTGSKFGFQAKPVIITLFFWRGGGGKRLSLAHLQGTW